MHWMEKSASGNRPLQAARVQDATAEAVRKLQRDFSLAVAVTKSTLFPGKIGGGASRRGGAGGGSGTGGGDDFPPTLMHAEHVSFVVCRRLAV